MVNLFLTVGTPIRVFRWVAGADQPVLPKTEKAAPSEKPSIAVLAAALNHQGKDDEARTQVKAALEAMPALTLSYLAEVLPTKQKGGLAPYLDALRQAGLPD